MQLFEEFVNLMDDVWEIYLKLFKLESEGKINDIYFLSQIEELKQKMNLEDLTFNKVVMSSEYDMVKSVLLKDNNHMFKRFREYLSLYGYVDDEIEDEKKLDVETKKLYRACAKSIYLVYLSLMQEYIDTVDNMELRDRMLLLKYLSAFQNLGIGNVLMEYNFQISRVNYVDLYLKAELIKLKDADSFDTILDANMSIIKEMMIQLFSVTDDKYQDVNILVAVKNIEFMIMACLLLINDSDYEWVKDVIFGLVYELSNNENNKACDIIDNIIESRSVYKSRVRKISLRPLEG